MHLTVRAAAAILAFCAGAFADQCASGATLAADGNWYCSAVQAIQYSNVGVAGTYNQVTAMGADGTCSSVPISFSGPIAPLDEEVSLHFRGPLHLTQFAAYKLNAVSKREESKAHARRHAHQHVHKRHAEEGPVEEKRQMVYATIDGQVVSWVNNWFGPNGAPASTPAAAPAQATAPAAAKPASASDPVVNSTPGQYGRIGYYDSASQHLDGLTFLGNHGGAGSGVFDTTYGMSLAYLSADGTTGAASPQVLEDTTIGSNVEFTIMSDKPCNGDCNFVRPGTVAYHGFDSADKVFLIEFQMPYDGTKGFNADMPAIWMLNAQIPRTLQYGNPTCSCWTTGCGEFDIVEVLSSGSDKCKSTFHTNTPGGDSDYIERPAGSSMKLAVIFSSASSTATIQVLDNSVTFDTSLTSAQISAFTSSTPANLLSLFTISS